MIVIASLAIGYRMSRPKIRDLAEFQQKWNLIEPDAVRNFTRDINLLYRFPLAKTS